jgi:hypothetical protein
MQRLKMFGILAVLCGLGFFLGRMQGPEKVHAFSQTVYGPGGVNPRRHRHLHGGCLRQCHRGLMPA